LVRRAISRSRSSITAIISAGCMDYLLLAANL